MIEILKTNNVTFSFFDILSDNEVREGLKKFSNWPTYPQLYSKGYKISRFLFCKVLLINFSNQKRISWRIRYC